MLIRNKCAVLLPATMLITHYGTAFNWKSVFAKSEPKKDDSVESPSPLAVDFLERLQSRSLDDYTKRAIKGISDAVSKNARGSDKITVVNTRDSEGVDHSSIYDRVPELFAAFQTSLNDNKFKEKLSKLLDRNGPPAVSTDEATPPPTTTIKPRMKSDIYDIIPSSVLDEKTKGYLRELSSLGDRLRSQFEKSTMNLQHPFAINLGLLRLFIMHEAIQEQAMPEQHTSSSAAVNASAISETFIAEAKYFLRFAADVYDDNPYISSDDILLDQLGEHKKLGENVKIPRHVVFLDHLTQSIVVSIRGTGSVSDVLTDLHMDAQPFLRVQEGHIRAGAAAASAAANSEKERGVLYKAFERAAHRMQSSIDRSFSRHAENRALFAHRGMAESAHTLLPPVVAAIHDAHTRRGGRYRNYQIVVTGHSLGAGTGCLLAMLITANTSQAVKTFAFAPPPVISQEAYPMDRHISGTNQDPQRLFEDLPEGGLHSNCIIHSFINHNDVVPRSSHFELLNMLSAIGSVDALPWTPTERSLLLLRGKLTPEEVEQMKQRLKDAKNYHQENEGVELCVPGHVYWLRRQNRVSVEKGSSPGTDKDSIPPTPTGTKYRVHQLSDSRNLFNGYLYTGDSMVADHLVVNYMDAILNIESSDKVK